MTADGRVACANGYGTAGADRAMAADTPMPVCSVTTPLDDVRRYFLPDVTRLLLLTVIADLVQGVYMLVTAAAVRPRGTSHTAHLAS